MTSFNCMNKNTLFSLFFAYVTYMLKIEFLKICMSIPRLTIQTFTLNRLDYYVNIHEYLLEQTIKIHKC